jgi:hypothetical protein
VLPMEITGLAETFRGFLAASNEGGPTTPKP